MNIVVTIPAFNEAKSIGTVVRDIRHVLSGTGHSFKVLVIDDGSTDDTAAVARQAGAQVYSHPLNYGLGETFKTEMQKALMLKPDVIVHTDADGQYLAKDIPRLIQAIEQGNDLVLGSRFKGRIEEMPLIKRIGNRLFSMVISEITRTSISDGQTGFRAFTSKVASTIPINSNHTYTQEQIIRAVKAKFRVAEVPIYFAKRKHGKSRLISNPLSYAAKAGVNLIRIYRDYEPLKFFGAIGWVFIIAGCIPGILGVYSFITTGLVGGLPKIMVSVLLISIGVQIMLFGFLADMMNRG